METKQTDINGAAEAKSAEPPEKNDAAGREETKIAVSRRSDGTFSLAPRNFEEAWRMAQILASSDMVPKDYQGKAANVLIAMEMGAEIGLKPVQAIQNIAVINGRPAVWGDAMLALLQSSPEWDESAFDEFFQGEKYGDDYRAVCRMRRTGGKLTERAFSVADAKQAGLWSKGGPWKQYPDRMLQMRARSFAARDTFADRLRGISVAEEARDIPRHVEDAEVVDEAPTQSRTADVREQLQRRSAKREPEPEVEDAPAATEAAADLAHTAEVSLFDVVPTGKNGDIIVDDVRLAAQVRDEIAQMVIELEELAQCETAEEAGELLGQKTQRYHEAIKDWPKPYRDRFFEVYEATSERLNKAFKAQVPEPNETLFDNA